MRPIKLEPRAAAIAEIFGTFDGITQLRKDVFLWRGLPYQVLLPKEVPTKQKDRYLKMGKYYIREVGVKSSLWKELDLGNISKKS